LVQVVVAQRPRTATRGWHTVRDGRQRSCSCSARLPATGRRLWLR